MPAQPLLHLLYPPCQVLHRNISASGVQQKTVRYAEACKCPRDHHLTHMRLGRSGLQLSMRPAAGRAVVRGPEACVTWLLIWCHLSALGRGLAATDDCVFRDGWLLSIDDEPVRKGPRLHWTLGQLPLQLLQSKSICFDTAGDPANSRLQTKSYCCNPVDAPIKNASQRCSALQASACGPA